MITILVSPYYNWVGRCVIIIDVFDWLVSEDSEGCVDWTSVSLRSGSRRYLLKESLSVLKGWSSHFTESFLLVCHSCQVMWLNCINWFQAWSSILIVADLSYFGQYILFPGGNRHMHSFEWVWWALIIWSLWYDHLIFLCPAPLILSEDLGRTVVGRLCESLLHLPPFLLLTWLSELW